MICLSIKNKKEFVRLWRTPFLYGRMIAVFGLVEINIKKNAVFCIHIFNLHKSWIFIRLSAMM